MKSLFAVFLLSAAAVTASAKDKYSTGTVERRMMDAGYTDTTACYETPGAVHCAGDIREDQAPRYTLILPDGTKHHIEHVSMTRDTLKKMDFSKGPVTVQFRIDHRRGFGGVDYAAIVDPATGKEGAYSFDTLRLSK